MKSAVAGQCCSFWVSVTTKKIYNHIKAAYFYFHLLFMGVCKISDIPACNAVYKCELGSFKINTLSNIPTKQHCKCTYFTV